MSRSMVQAAGQGLAQRRDLVREARAALTDHKRAKRTAVQRPVMRDQQVAIHEAGHVVVAHVLGLVSYEVVLSPETVKKTGFYGSVRVPHPVFGNTYRSLRERRKAVRADVIASLGGCAAEHVACGAPLFYSREECGGDVAHILSLYQQGELLVPNRRLTSGTIVALTNHLSHLLRVAARLVRRHRPDVERLLRLAK